MTDYCTVESLRPGDRFYARGAWATVAGMPDTLGATMTVVPIAAAPELPAWQRDREFVPGATVQVERHRSQS